jgi:antibiotic biosynthesis monooxygenase (ABM) superfamily enzyme
MGRTRVRDAGRFAGLVPAALLVLACSMPQAACAAAGEYVYVLHWTSRPDQDLLAGSAYTAWSRTAIPRCLAAPGLSGLTTYRAAAGEPHIITLFTFPSFASLAAWRADPGIEALTEESRRYTYEMITEVWGPSPYAGADTGRGSASAAGHVLYVFEWDVFPGKEAAYRQWIAKALTTWTAGPGIERVTAHRVVVGTHTDVFECEFPNFEAWAKWYENSGIQQTRAESRELIVNTRTELWGPNPLFPEAVSRPRKP